jgi:DNA-directed RNA polymerase subunit delta
MTDLKQVSLMEAAEYILRQNKQPMTFYELFAKISEIKELTQEQKDDLIAKFYTDFIISAKFIYMGDDQWDLKSRQSIDLWDKDGAYYREFPDDDETEVAEEDDDEEEVLLDDDSEEEEGEEEEEVIYEKDFADDVLDEEVEEEDELLVDEVESFDDDKYNEYMDDYEDMYDE